MYERMKEKLTKKTKRNQILQQLSSNSNHASTSTFQSSSVISEEIMNDNLSTSEESSESIILEENTRIRKAIVSWTQGKVTKAGWLAFKRII